MKRNYCKLAPEKLEFIKQKLLEPPSEPLSSSETESDSEYDNRLSRSFNQILRKRKAKSTNKRIEGATDSVAATITHTDIGRMKNDIEDITIENASQHTSNIISSIKPCDSDNSQDEDDSDNSWTDIDSCADVGDDDNGTVIDNTADSMLESFSVAETDNSFTDVTTDYDNISDVSAVIR